MSILKEGEIIQYSEDGRATVVPRVCFDYSKIAEKDILKLGATIRTVEGLYKTYLPEKIARQMHISPTNTGFRNINHAHKFFYGVSTSSKNLAQSSMKPKDWNAERISRMNWESFLSAFYTLLCSENTFFSKAWSVMETILDTLKEFTVEEWSKFPEFKGCSESEVDLVWENVSYAISKKTEEFMCSETCRVVSWALKRYNNVLTPAVYNSLKAKACSFFSELVLKRFEEAKIKAVGNGILSWLDIEAMYDIEEFLDFSSVDDGARRTLHEYLIGVGEWLINKDEDVIFIDKTFSLAMKCAMTDEEKKNAQRGRNVVAPRIRSIEKAKMKKKRNAERRKKALEVYFGIVRKIWKICALMFCASTILGIIGIVFGMGVFAGVMWSISGAIFALAILTIIIIILDM